MGKQPHLFMQFNGQREDFLPKDEKCGLQNGFASRIFRGERIYGQSIGYTNKGCVRPPHTCLKEDHEGHAYGKRPCGEVGLP